MINLDGGCILEKAKDFSEKGLCQRVRLWCFLDPNCFSPMNICWKSQESDISFWGSAICRAHVLSLFGLEHLSAHCCIVSFSGSPNSTRLASRKM